MRKTLVAAALGLSLIGAPATFAQTACDLSTTTSCTIGAAVFAQMGVPVQQADQMSFLQLQSGGSTTETGFNSAGVAVSSLQQVTLNGTSYRLIGLDVNQNQANPAISLDMLQIFGSNSATGTAGNLGTLVFDLGTNWITLRGSPGTSRGDAWFLIPDALLSQFQFLFLNAGFGQHIAANGGFEEFFTTRNAVFAVPEPSIAWLLGLGFAGLIALRRKRFFS